MYYKLDCDYPENQNDSYYFIQDGIDVDGVDSWALGKPITAKLPNPLIVPITQVGESDHAKLTPIPFRDAYLCLATAEIVAALLSCGADNLQVYPALLIDAKTSREFQYFAINIIGTIKAADLEKSKWINIDAGAEMDSIFEKLIIDASKVNSASIFRLFEDTGSIIVSEPVKKALEQIDYLKFQPISS